MWKIIRKITSSGKYFNTANLPNAPEVKEPYYEEAKAFTENLVLGKEISFEQEENYRVDKFAKELRLGIWKK